MDQVEQLELLKDLNHWLKTCVHSVTINNRKGEALSIDETISALDWAIEIFEEA
jgi:hypothetical protein